MWKWVITLLGIPVGTNLSIFLPRVEGIYIGSERKKIDVEQIKEKELFEEKGLTTVAGVKIDNKEGKPNVKIWLPCIKGDFVGDWMQKWGADSSRSAIKQATTELNDIMKDTANTIFGCGNWFSSLTNSKKLKVLKNKLTSMDLSEQQSSSGLKEVKMGLDIKAEVNDLTEESSNNVVGGVRIRFKERKIASTENYSKFQEDMKKKLLESIKSVLREGKWSKQGLISNNLESEFTSSSRYTSETNSENSELRAELDNCGKKCLLNGGSGIGISWHPSIRTKGGSGWFEDKLKSQDTKDFDMALHDALKSMWFNWANLRVVIENELMRRLVGKQTQELDNKVSKLCRMGEWGFVCPEGGLVWGK
ncbi:hypothetical protein [Mycoplasma suis]|uniref:Uncharacterized protein n=1 Tax=Mycoplasma suis (strain Illinois) TaxID=768700 RepID=F0QS60_MYCSL|nr:hypothetical protein [Mycoplasma suis]ADX98330.1 hypothetical protein MSU_0809 [Mycoplasma suis str. Illinois]